MPIDRIRPMPTDKILSRGYNPRVCNMLKELETTPDKNAASENANEDSDDSMDSTAPVLPAPRRSTAARSGIRSLISSRRVLLWLILLAVVLLLLPRFKPTSEISISNDLAILLWNADNRTIRWSHYQCGCLITSKPKYDDGAIDAVVINADIPYTLLGLSKIRRTAKFLVVLAAKRPLNLAQNPLSMEGETYFNFTMTYRFDSDLVWTDYYFSTLHKTRQRVKKNFQTPDKNLMTHLTERAAAQLRFKLKLKHRPVMHVTDGSLPESDYLEELRKHIDVDAIQSCQKSNECMLYHFMLIFNPSSCPDYVPPHFYIALANNLVPVVIGSGNVNQLVPPGSYIISADFQSPQELAAHLKKLTKEPTQYEQFFWWHSKYKLKQESHAYCRLCRELRQPRKEREPEEFLQWWAKYMCPNLTDEPS